MLGVTRQLVCSSIVPAADSRDAAADATAAAAAASSAVCDLLLRSSANIASPMYVARTVARLANRYFPSLNVRCYLRWR